MYTPPHFEEFRASALHALMQAHSFATIVSQSGGQINADHLPLLLRQSNDSAGTLQGHIARANPLWQTVSDGSEVLAIFQGPDRYVSPKWYPSKQEHGKVVPTWNFLVVHARGTIRWNQNPGWLRQHLESLTATHEGPDQPWRISDAPASYIERMLTAIIGFEIAISDLRGKWKLSQNRDEADRLGVIAELKSQSNDAAAEMLHWMRDDGSAA